MSGPARDVIVVGKGKSELDAYLERALASEGRVAKREPTPEKGYYYRSDHFSFAKLGVPMLYFEGGEDLLDGGVEAGRAAAEDYTVNRYHAPGDEYNPDWDWRGTMADLKLYYQIGRELAETDAWPNWVEGDEFRAIRDRSAATRNGK
jgi:Zn-dependent M28 family amino/carboxypeptidase